MDLRLSPVSGSSNLVNEILNNRPPQNQNLLGDESPGLVSDKEQEPIDLRIETVKYNYFVCQKNDFEIRFIVSDSGAR